MNNKLYELTEQYDYMAELLEQLCLQQMGILDEDVDSINEKLVKDTLEAIDGEIEDKADGIAKMLRNNEAMADALKAEEKRLNTRRKALENADNFLKKYLQANLEFIGKTKFKTALFSYSIAKNGGLQPLTITDNLDEIPGKYLIPQPPVPNNDAIRKLLAEKEVEWAKLEPRGKHLTIR